MDFETLYLKTPPCPSKCAEVESSTPEANQQTEFLNTEPGLNGQQLSKLLGLQLNEEPSEVPDSSSAPSSKEGTSTGSSNNTAVSAKKTLVNIPANEEQLQARLLHQQEALPQWHNLVDKKLILKQGLIDKRKV